MQHRQTDPPVANKTRFFYSFFTYWKRTIFIHSYFTIYATAKPVNGFLAAAINLRTVPPVRYFIYERHRRLLLAVHPGRILLCSRNQHFCLPEFFTGRIVGGERHFYQVI